MSDIQTCEDLTFCSSELSRAFLDVVAEQTVNDDMNGDHADDATWILSASFIILTMQSGFGLLEMGSAVAGNEVNIMMKNAADVIFGSLAYWLLGYGISFGSPSIPFMGLGDFALNGGTASSESGLLYSRYIFQFSFAATSTTIVSGMVAMRLRFFMYCLFSFFAVVAYAFPAHWVWASDGWLATMGAYDFAGAGPVHLFGGVNGLVAISILGPRTGRFDGSRPKSDFRPVSQTSMLFGLFMLWWGWIGFNCGSTFGITGTKWIVATRAAITTVNGTGAGGAAAMAFSMFKTSGKTLKVEDLVNGILGALVTSSASCSVVNTYDALILGATGALVALFTNKLIMRMELDDVVGAFGVHAGCGIWGLICVGLFADGSLPGVEVRNGLFRGGGLGLLGLQLLSIVVITAWGCMFSGIFFYVFGVAISKDWKDPRSGIRVSLEEEECGADAFLHGVGVDEENEDLSRKGGTENGFDGIKVLPETEGETNIVESTPVEMGGETNAAVLSNANDTDMPLDEEDDIFNEHVEDLEMAIIASLAEDEPERRPSVNAEQKERRTSTREDDLRDRRRSIMKAASKRRNRDSMRVLM